MNGPTIVRPLDGSTRCTLNAPRSWVTGAIRLHHSSPGATGADAECVDPLVHQIAQRGIDRALPLDAAHSGEGGAFDGQAEMAFAGRIVAAVAAMLFAVVDQRQTGRRERGVRGGVPFRRRQDRWRLSSLRLYRRDGVEGEQMARPGRRCAGPLRASGMRGTGRVQGAAGAGRVSTARAAGASCASTMSASTMHATISSTA